MKRREMGGKDGGGEGRGEEKKKGKMFIIWGQQY